MPAPRRPLQRLVLASFVVTFAVSRLLVYLIMSRQIPDFYLHLGGTHVHHLNYGIALLGLVGALLLFAPPRGRALGAVAVAYGAGLALTFDEFGMWLHLGGSYWQRASFDAVNVIGGLLLLAAYTPPLRQWTPRRCVQAALLLALVALFFWRLSLTLAPLAQRLSPRLQQLEQAGPR